MGNDAVYLLVYPAWLVVLAVGAATGLLYATRRQADHPIRPPMAALWFGGTVGSALLAVAMVLALAPGT